MCVQQPVVTSYSQPCSAHITVLPCRYPSAREAPLCEHTLSMAWSAPSKLTTKISSRPCAIQVISPGDSSESGQTEMSRLVGASRADGLPDQQDDDRPCRREEDAVKNVGLSGHMKEEAKNEVG